jgi:hypothetical protein
MRVLWNEVIGFVFICFAVWSLFRAFREFQALEEDVNSSGRLALSIIFGLLMLFFGVTSFMRARRINRS